MTRYLSEDVIKHQVSRIEHDGVVETEKLFALLDNMAQEQAEWRWVEVRKNAKVVDYVQCSNCLKTNRTSITTFCPHCGKPMNRPQNRPRLL